MNGYQRHFADAIDNAKSIESCKQLFTLCCEGKKDGKQVARGCMFCGNCNEKICGVALHYQTKMIELENLPTFPKRTHFVKTRDYKIKPKTQCARTVKAQITKLSKKFDSQYVPVLATIQDHIENERFKRALNLAEKYQFDTIANTISNYINGKLGTANSENK